MKTEFTGSSSANANPFLRIYQELSAVPEMTVAENVLLGREPVRGFARTVDRNAMRTETRRLCGEIGTALDPDAAGGRRLERHACPRLGGGTFRPAKHPTAQTCR